jgi:ATP-dependent DNA ligase
MFYDNKDVRKLPWKDRQPFLDCFELAPSQLMSKDEGQVYRINVQKKNFIKFYEVIVAKEDPLEEGIVVKNINSQYEYNSHKSFETAKWLKIKKVMES